MLEGQRGSQRKLLKTYDLTPKQTQSFGNQGRVKKWLSGDITKEEEANINDFSLHYKKAKRKQHAGKYHGNEK